jgi:hypothetical protein
MRGPVFVFFVVALVALIPALPVSAQNCESLDAAVRTRLEPWLAKGTGLFENPFARRFEWCFVTSRKDWTGDEVEDVLLFRALRSFDKRADVWVTAWLPLRGNAAPLVTQFTFDEVLSRVSYKGFLWRAEHQGWVGFYSDTILLGFGGKLFEPDARGPNTNVLDWLMATFGISQAKARDILPQYYWRERTFVIRYLP